MGGREKDKPMANKWRCGNCGYRLEADAPPDVCPGCKQKCEFIDDNPYVPIEGGRPSPLGPAPPELQPRVLPEKCTGCGKCVEVCPIEAIRLVEGVAVIDPEVCDADGLCLPACPEGAIVIPV